MTTPEILLDSVDFGENPYLNGAHEPLRSELDNPQIKIIGDIPKDFSGIYLRNGPNQRFEPLGMYHWFDGDGMIHAAEFREGQVFYRNRWIRTKGLEYEIKKKPIYLAWSYGCSKQKPKR